MGKKTIVLMVITLILMQMLSAGTHAQTVSNTVPLSQQSDDEIFAFLDGYGVAIPGGEINRDYWAEFVRSVIKNVETNPETSFAFNFTVAQEFAEEIKTAVKLYYGLQARGSSRATNAYTLQHSTVYESWRESFKNYNCYTYVLGITNMAKNPGYKSGVSYSTVQPLSTMVSYVKSDLNALNKSCVKVTSSRPTLSSIPSGANAICLRIGDVDYHFMMLTEDGWLHKPGRTQTLKWNYSSPGAVVWISEYVEEDIAYLPENYYTYDSSIKYFIYKANHASATSQYTGEEYHSGSMHYFVYQDICEDCGHVFRTYTTSVECDGPPCSIYVSAEIPDADPVAVE